MGAHQQREDWKCISPAGRPAAVSVSLLQTGAVSESECLCQGTQGSPTPIEPPTREREREKKGGGGGGKARKTERKIK